jgi:hypothetical protein
MEVNNAVLEHGCDEADRDFAGFWARVAPLPWFRRWDAGISTIEKARRAWAQIREEVGARPRPERA